MTNEDRGAIVELIDDLRSYTHDWDWKYGAFWDVEIARVRGILSALAAPPAREETKFPAPFEGCDHTTPERVEAVWHAQLCPICATKNWRAAQRELEQLRSATPASAPEAKETNDGHDSGVDAGGADRSCGSRDGRGVASVDHREEDCPAPMVTDPAPVPRCDGSPGEPGWSLTPTGCVRFDNNGQMIRCSGCPSCQGRK